MTSTPSVSSSSLMVSGGSSRMMLPYMPHVKTMTPAAWAAVASFVGQLGVGVGGPGFDQLDGDHGAPAPHIADPVVGGLQPQQRVHDQPFEVPGTLDQAVALDGRDGGQRSRAGHRVAAEGAAEATDVRGVHDLGPAGHRR